MITLYSGSGAGDFEIYGDTLDDQEHESIMLNARQILRVRGENLAVQYLESAPFRVCEGTNHFNDVFQILVAHVPLQEYEGFRILAGQASARRAFHQIAAVLTELGPYIRFIAVGLKQLSAERWDVFICHASEEKVSVAEPLYEHLDSVGIKCWYDRGEILWGDSIVGKINEGLRCSRFVIVIVSPSLLRKTWATKEMNAALSQEIDSGTTRVLPLMVGTAEEIQQMVNELAVQRDKRYLKWSGNPQEIESELRALIRRENSKGNA
ncbi:MAG: toll/interleukin-1 receptor domain-containing protein [Desulfoferrobacter sp.]